MRIVVGLASLIVAGSMCSALLGAGPNSKLRGELAEVVRDAGKGALIPITIVLQAQVAAGDLAQASAIPDKGARRNAVKTLLKDQAQVSQQGLLDQLATEQEAGEVGSRLRALWLHNVVATQATADAIRRIAQRDDVAYVNYDKPVGQELFPIEPFVPDMREGGQATAGGNIECGVQLMRAPEVWNDLGFTGEGVIVGIIDTGCCITHPDLANQIWINEDEIPGNGIDDDKNGYPDDINGYDFHNDTGNVTDTSGHGTHTTGTVSGDGTNGTTTGMAPDVSMMILKFWNNFAGESVVWEAMQYAVDNDADVITASIGWPHGVNPDRVTWRIECENAIAAGVVVIYAAGNEGCGNPPDNVRTPGDVPDVITIGATDCNDIKANFSSCGPITWQNIPPWNDCPLPDGCIKPSVAAPGVNTVSTRNNCSGYVTLSGTSMATPHVAGAVALMLEANPNLDHFQVKEILQQTSVDLGANGMDNSFGAGRVDALEAVLLALDMAVPCPWDLDDSGTVGAVDLLGLLFAWGPNPGHPADFDGDGSVGASDLAALLTNWGPCP
ncbi:MAG: S8 family serine peptidase [Phycisphaerales bacterium]